MFSACSKVYLLEIVAQNISPSSAFIADRGTYVSIVDCKFLQSTTTHSLWQVTDQSYLEMNECDVRGKKFKYPIGWHFW